MIDKQRDRAINRIARDMWANAMLEPGVTLAELKQVVARWTDEELEQGLAEIAAVEEYHRQRREPLFGGGESC